MNKAELEICCPNWRSAQAAEQAGVHRIELCSSLSEGGITPSAGLIQQCVNELSIHVHVLIRARAGDFLYSEEELAIMRKDVVFCKEQGVDGVVFGFLNTDGSINIERTREFVALAHPMKTTFHRAFDRCAQPFLALEELIALKIDYILTSGQKATALEGASMIRQLVKKAKGRVKMMAGSGVRTHLLAELMRKTKASAYHLSSRIEIESAMQYRESEVSMGSQSPKKEQLIISQDIHNLQEARRILDEY
jgi:copper homeostasis protein